MARQNSHHQFLGNLVSALPQRNSRIYCLQEQYSDKGLQFIGIAIDDQDSVQEYLLSTKINYPILIGGVTGIALAQQLGNSFDAVPFTLVVNQQGQIIHRQPGEFSREQIMEIIAPLIN